MRAAVTEPAPDRVRELAEAIDGANADSPSSRFVAPEPMQFDFDAEPEPPLWVVERVFERGTVNLLSGDTGSAKSIILQDLGVAAVKGRDWLGRWVIAERVLYIDEENPERLVRARLRALGMTNKEREGLLYYNRQGVSLPLDDHLRWLEMQIEEHEPTLVIIDTALSATNVDVNDNPAVAQLLKTLRRLAAAHDIVVVVAHHERKASADQRYDASQAAMGARSWAGQVDAHSTITRDERLTELPADRPGRRRLRSTFRWHSDTKGRAGEPGNAEHVVITSEKDGAGRLLSLCVESAGLAPEKGVVEHELAVDIAWVVRRNDGPTMRTGQLAEAVGREPDDGTFKRGLVHAVDQGWLTRPKKGQYAVGEEQPPVAG